MAKRFSKVREADKRGKSLIDAVTEEGKSNPVGRPPKSDEPLRKFNCKVPESTYLAFQNAVESEGKNMTWVIVRYMEQYAKSKKGED